MFFSLIAGNDCTAAYPPLWALCVGFCVRLAAVRCSLHTFFLFFYFIFFLFLYNFFDFFFDFLEISKKRRGVICKCRVYFYLDKNSSHQMSSPLSRTPARDDEPLAAGGSEELKVEEVVDEEVVAFSR